jgi:hypothetical protein
MRNFKDFFASSNDLVVPADEMIDEVVEETAPEVITSETSSETTESAE